MQAVREVQETSYLELDLNRPFRASLPTGFLDEEPRRERIQEIWETNVRPVVNEIRNAARNRFLMNRHIQKAVFESKMETVCQDFSRRTENVKVSFVKTSTSSCSCRQGRSSGRKQPTEIFHLKIVKLSPITDEQRNARHCLAEIPNQQYVPDVQAEVVGTADASIVMEPSEIAISAPFDMTTPRSSSVVPTAPTRSEVLIASAEVWSGQATSLEESYVNPPVATEVTAIVEEYTESDTEMLSGRSSNSSSCCTGREPPSQRSALERMQELEIIKPFLTEAEYVAKRQEILGSI